LLISRTLDFKEELMKIIDIQDGKEVDNAIRSSIKILVAGGLIIYPTDTIYGIGCDVYNVAALKKIAEIKRRKDLQPYLIFVNSYEMIEEYAIIQTESLDLLHKHWPGPLTVLFKPRKILSRYILGNVNKIAIRIPDNEFCLKLLNAYGKPITSTSANLHCIPQQDFKKITDLFKDEVDVIIYDGEVNSTQPSTIIDLSEGEMKVLREGKVKINPKP
jgi:L-threonylcarbamoyladenylate synthase